MSSPIFTFHYASTISLSSYPVAALEIYLYIPLCFYYIMPLIIMHSRLSQLYIPLCFYYILRQGSQPSRFSKLYIPLCLKPLPQWALRSILYIPLCFYYIHNWWLLCQGRYPLYIPLCFYYILELLKANIGLEPLHSTMLLLYPATGSFAGTTNVFTFHHASTISDTCRSQERATVYFTFHYASTISKLYPYHARN